MRRCITPTGRLIVAQSQQQQARYNNMRSAARAVQRVHVATTTSTMDDARRLVDAACATGGTPGSAPQLPEAIAVTADVQSHGRGSDGRPWHSTAGNVLLTLAVPKHYVPAAVLPVLPLLVGLAVRDAVRGAAPDDRVAGRVMTKWPNDVLYDRRKVSGAIIEDAGAALLVGIGINVAHAPPPGDGGRASACIGEFNEAATAAAVAAACTDRLLERLDAAADRAAVVAEYRDAMDWTCDMFRRLPGGVRGGRVQPVKLSDFGELTVRDVDTGDVSTLISDYCF